jgi:endonuclease III
MRCVATSLFSRAYEKLTASYPYDSLGNKANPLDELLYIVLSLRTHESGFRAAYSGFKRAFPAWAMACKASRRQIAGAIAAGGLAKQKAFRIKAALDMIQAQFGEPSLRRLKRAPVEEVERILLALPGIGAKSARCIMMYSLGFKVLPVDVHVARVSQRLGLVPRVTHSKLHGLLERIVPPDFRYAFHVYCVQHGRRVCRGQYPQCGRCCLADICPHIGVVPPEDTGRSSPVLHCP